MSSSRRGLVATMSAGAFNNILRALSRAEVRPLLPSTLMDLRVPKTEAALAFSPPPPLHSSLTHASMSEVGGRSRLVMARPKLSSALSLNCEGWK